MKDKVPPPQDKLSARRRLLHGSFAAPAALTLFSGSAFANTSSVRCIANQVSDPVLPVATTGPDVWVRVQLWTLGSGGNLSTWVRGSEVVALANGNTDYSAFSSSEWRCFSAASGSGFTVNQSVNPGPPTKGSATPVHNGTYVAVRVDSTGKIIGVVGLNGTSGSAVRQATCWASFVATI